MPREKPTRSFSAGFTLLETLVALLILVSAMLGPVALGTRSVVAISSSRNQITAVFLAQDAIEFIRARKVTNSLQNQPWLTGLGGSAGQSLCFNSGGCFIDTANGAVMLAGACGGVSPPSDCYVKRNTATGAYTHDTADPATPFIRRVYMTRRCPGPSPSCPQRERKEANVRVEVEWQERSSTRRVAIETEIFCFERSLLDECNK